MKASKPRRAAPVRIVAVAAPIGWDKMFKRDPEGPEIQAFLNATLAQRDVGPATTKKPRNVRVKRDVTAGVVKRRQKRQKKK